MMNLSPKKPSESRLCVHRIFVSESGFQNKISATRAFLNDEGGIGTLVLGIKGNSKFVLLI